MSIETVSRPLPPLVPGLPVLGSALEMSKDTIGFVLKQYRQYGPIFRVRALNQEIIVLAGPKANIFVTQEGADKLSSRRAWDKFGLEFGVEDHMLNLDGEPHLRFRKLVKRAYSASNVMSNIPLLVEIAQSVLKRYKVGEEVPALQLIRQIVTAQLGRMLADYTPDKDLEQITTTIRTALNVHITGRSPGWALHLPSYRRAKRHYLQMGRSIVNKHRTTSRQQPNLVDDILSASQQEQHQDILGKEEQILFAALGPFVAGLDTVANECTFMLYALFQHPEVLQQCREEADQLFAQGTPDFKQLKNMHYLHNAMLETLRLYSIAPAVYRHAAKTFEFGGYQVPEGQALLVASTVSHFLPEFFTDPYTFDVTRYDEPRKEHKKRGAFAPFGIGTHICLGAGAAEVQIALVLASLLHIVRLEWANPNEKLPIKNDPTPTLGMKFRVSIAEERHSVITA